MEACARKPASPARYPLSPKYLSSSTTEERAVSGEKTATVQTCQGYPSPPEEPDSRRITAGSAPASAGSAISARTRADRPAIEPERMSEREVLSSEPAQPAMKAAGRHHVTADTEKGRRGRDPPPGSSQAARGAPRTTQEKYSLETAR
ncbi:MAG: hypothetical protein AVO35_08295 [Candidatus Aegiribacteria sp. MLS_C]|nr:MAG: hypothetical protein AVO35_08295 [Candidatus Aegiribacteria sp. MLS_C]